MLDALVGQTDDDRKATLERVHPQYQEQAQHWEVLLDALEGTGGFSDGGYIWRFRSEIPEDYNERKAHARYHNYVEALVELYVRYILSDGVTRETDNAELEDWWRDVDGAKTDIDAFVRRALTFALAAGHVGALVDKTPDPPTGPSKADERAEVIATLYASPSILDWRFEGGVLSGLKLKECAPEGGIAEEPPEYDYQYLLWDTDQWARFDADGDPLEGGPQDHHLGLVPFTVLRPKPLLRDKIVGRALVGHANVVKALFNRQSEEDDVLRAQAFSLLAAEVTDPAATGAEVEETQKNIAANYGTRRVIVTKAKVYRVNADMSGTQMTGENIAFLIREMFRAAHVPFQSDTKDVKAAEALALEHRELNEMLHGVASALQAFELEMARAWCHWQSPTKEAGEALFEAANVRISYPREFFTESLQTDLEAWGEAVTAVSSNTFRKRIEKRIVQRVDPDLELQQPEEYDKVVQEIEASQDPKAQMLQQPNDLRANAQKRLAAFTQAQQPPTVPSGQAA